MVHQASYFEIWWAELLEVLFLYELVVQQSHVHWVQLCQLVWALKEFQQYLQQLLDQQFDHGAPYLVLWWVYLWI